MMRLPRHPEARLHTPLICLAATAAASAAHGQTEPLRIATWNLGWHVSQQELSPWIAQCSRTYARDAQGVWRLVAAGTPQARRGWDIEESRATLEGVDLSVMPPCGVYLTPAFQGIEVTANAYARRVAQVARVLAADVRPDVIAFQEVSGSQAVREALGPASADYHVCSFDGAYKVQRLAFAWKKTLGAAAQACTDLPALSLPALPPERRVRPGYAVTLELGGRRVRFLTLHLKSGCVTPLEKDRLDGNQGRDDPCPVLQKQVAPLEQAWEQLADGVDGFVVLGDFNRNLWHEAGRVAGAEAVRSDGQTDLALPRPAGVATRNLLAEVNDGSPAASRAVLLEATCPGTREVAAACAAARTVRLDNAQRALLASPAGLGCRNAVGLDHVLVSQSLAASVVGAAKVPLGTGGRSLGPRPPQFPEPLLAVSDHCPLVFEIKF